jgi:hypothetical protein
MALARSILIFTLGSSWEEFPRELALTIITGSPLLVVLVEKAPAHQRHLHSFGKSDVTT